MRIAVNASLLDTNPTGLGTYTQHVVGELGQMLRAGRFRIYTTHPEALREYPGLAGAIARVPSMFQPRYGKKAAFLRFIWTQLALPFALREYDLFYSPTHHGLLRSTLPQVLTIHDLLPIKFPAQYKLQHYYFRMIVPRLLSRAAAIIVDSENTKRDLEDYYDVPPFKIHVVYSGIEPHFRSVPNRVKDAVLQRYALKQYVLIVGATFPHKNVGVAMEAWRYARSQCAGTELVIVGGRQGYVDALKRQADGYGAGVRFLGYVSKDDLPSLYSGAQALLYPSLYEGFGLPPLEAMACGCPVMVSRTASLPEVCGEAAYYVDPYDAKAMGDALVEVLTNPDLREELRRKGFERVKAFSWQRTAREIYAVIRGVVQG